MAATQRERGDGEERQPRAAGFVEPAAERRSEHEADVGSRHDQPHHAAALSSA